jgi:hypothetical protein
MGPFAQTLLGGGADPPRIEAAADRSDEPFDARKAVEDLKQQVDALRKELQSGQEGRAAGLSRVD